jgi:hypothetical protein
LEKFQSTSTIDLVTLETRRSRYIEELSKHGLTDTQEDNLEGSSELKSAYAKLESSYQLEHQEIARALERVELLLALRDDSTSVGGGKWTRQKWILVLSTKFSCLYQNLPADARNGVWTAVPFRLRHRCTTIALIRPRWPAMYLQQKTAETGSVAVARQMRKLLAPSRRPVERQTGV